MKQNWQRIYFCNSCWRCLSFILSVIVFHACVDTSVKLSSRLITLERESHFVVAAGYESFDWQALDSGCWIECKKGSVGDWRWSLDNIRWPLRAAETISLHGATLLLLSCLDTFFFFSLSNSVLSPSLFLSLCLLSGVSASWQPVSDPEVIYW